ncbi:MAG: polyprenol phosphomannose-dependent alpha 1,6 mannosyltransferase MptB [Jatrophihabitantaceae bacterium]
MNDLAEQALHGLDLARKQIIRHPVASLTVGGFLAATVTMVAGGQIGASASATPLRSWFGLLPDNGTAGDAVAGTVMFGGILALLLLWIVAVARLRPNACSERQLWTLVGAWAAPFVLGPPLLSTDIYTFAGQGLLQRAGIDPYKHGPSALGHHAIVNAIDPTWRSVPSTSGPLGTLLEHLAVAITGGDAFGTVLVLRVLGLACLFAIGRLAGELAGPHRIPAIALTALNPALLLYVVSSAHLDGVLVALLLGSLIASAQRRWLLALVLVCAAAATKPVAIAAVPAVLLAHCLGQRSHIAWRIAARDVAIAIACLAAFSFLVPDGLGWRHNFSSVTREHTPFAPASIVSDMIRWIVPSASFDDLAVGGRIAVVVAAVGIVIYLLVTMRARSLDRTIGYSLLAIGLLSPVLYPWYLLWGVVCLAPAAVGVRRDWVVALSCAACVLIPAGFSSRVADTVTLVTLLVIAIVLLPTLYLHHQAQRRLTVG